MNWLNPRIYFTFVNECHLVELFKTNSNGAALKLRNSEKVIEEPHCYIIGIPAICVS
jgi:hypothetical protein